MEALYTSFLLLLVMIFFLGSGVWIFISLVLVCIIGLSAILGFSIERTGTIMITRFHQAAGSWEIACIPMFMWMGELVVRTDIAERLFRGLTPLVNKLPGRLLHTNVAGCAIFAAVSGSSTATTATIGKITLGELKKRGYDLGLSLGSLAGAGSFGLMIPPSIVFIIYGILSDQSIAKLFLAGIFPGLILAGLYSLYIMARTLMDPAKAPKLDQKYTLKEYLNCFVLMSPILVLIVVVLGSIYSGIATPTEAAAVGVAVALLMIICMKQMTKELFWSSISGALEISCMVCTLLGASAFLSTGMGLLHIPQNISIAIGSFNLTPYQLLMVLAVFYTILGFFLDGISIVVMSLPICLPLIVNAGFDPIWFGVFVVTMTEMAMITPPVGFNLFVIQGMSGYPIGTISMAAIPFFFLMLIGVIIISLFPECALWLPELLLPSK
jgi:tripartite ATP-independent transporter DctM subunit